MDTQHFFVNWVTSPDALPLVLTGGETAITAALAQLSASFTVADIHHVAPQGRTIPITDIRALQKVVGQRAWSGNRLVIISEAEKLSTAAAQALLKTLEESTRTSRFVITTQWYRRLLPTIRSRCVRVRLFDSPVSERTALPATLPAGTMARLAHFAGDTPLMPATLDEIQRALEGRLRQEGPTAPLRTAYLRLRDYHRITAEPGGNHKLARDVLLASLPPTV